MGKPSTSGADSARRVLAGTFTVDEQVSDWFVLDGDFNVALSGTAVATVQLEMSFDGGATAHEIWAGGTQLYDWTYNSVAFVEVASNPEAGVLVRLHCTAYTSGALNYRLSQ